MSAAPPSLPREIADVLVRILAYISGLAILCLAIAGLVRMPETDAGDPSPQPKWVEVERPRPAFELLLPEVASPPAYAVRRRDADGARKDVLTWGEAGAEGPYVSVEIYRPGEAGEVFLDAESEVAARIADFAVTDDVKPAGALTSKFGLVRLVDFAIAVDGRERRCLGFARTFEDPELQIVGWYCSAGEEVVNRATLACAIDRLTLVSAGSEPKLAELFARAEIRRGFCGERNPILAATPEHQRQLVVWRTAKLRGRIRSP